MCYRLLILLALSLPAGAGADAGTEAYALVVGSNRAGEGQKELRYAGQDAQRVAAVLVELGGYEPKNVQILLEPGRDEVLESLDGFARRLAEHRQRDEQSVFLFYYSGHARARALNLGPEEIGLDDLKQRLYALRSTVTLVVLDACQTGAISRVKGVEPAADFSRNSVTGLTTAGMAVMASSAATELSQESEQLMGSFFTHHLVTGLRGAADSDADGRVSLSEAYRYAYNRTLVSTASTAVGRQHVTLQTDLRGKGEMVLTRPAEASARLEFGADLQAEVLVHRADSQVVVAEVHKAAGSSLTLALPAGEYAALVRRGETVERCPLALDAGRTVELSMDDCEEVALDEVGVKGEADTEYESLETMGFELAVGGLFGHRDQYVEKIEIFGYEPDDGLFADWPDFHYSLAVTYSPFRHLSLVLTMSSLDDGKYNIEKPQMSGDPKKECFEWSSYRLGLQVRGSLPLVNGWLVPYVQAGGGPALGITEYTVGGKSYSEDFWGYHLSAAAGLQLMPTIKWWRHIGAFAQVEYIYAPAIENEKDSRGDFETHDSGGFAFMIGMRGSF